MSDWNITDIRRKRRVLDMVTIAREKVTPEEPHLFLSSKHFTTCATLMKLPLRRMFPHALFNWNLPDKHDKETGFTSK